MFPYNFPLLTIILVLLPAALLAGSSLDEYVGITWGDGRAKFVNNGDELTMSLDQASGSGFQLKNEYLFGRIGMQLKLVPGNSAGTVTAFYLMSDDWDSHDELDFEFLGNTTGEPYTVHTNVFVDGKGGREQQFRLWFDPAEDFHTYSFLWNPHTIVFSIDDTPIREFPNKEQSKGVPFPKSQAMRLYSSIWNADQWATQGGRIKTDWTHAPFTASYREFHADACVAGVHPDHCTAASANPWMWEKLNPTAKEKLREVQGNYMIYNYCTDAGRFWEGFPAECDG